MTNRNNIVVPPDKYVTHDEVGAWRRASSGVWLFINCGILLALITWLFIVKMPEWGWLPLLCLPVICFSIKKFLEHKVFYLPINKGRIFVDELNNKLIVFGGIGQSGFLVKPFFSTAESDKDEIDLSRRQVGGAHDLKEKIVSSDGTPHTVIISFSFALDLARLIEYRKIDPRTIDVAIEGAIVAALSAVGNKLKSEEIQAIGPLKSAVLEQLNGGQNSTIPDNKKIVGLIDRWPISDIQFDIESALPSKEVQQVQEGKREALIIQGIARDFEQPLPLPPRRSAAYKAYLMLAQTEFPNEVAVKPQQKDVLVMAYILKKRKGLDATQAMQNAMQVVDKAIGINISGKGGTPIIATSNRKNK